MKKLALILSIFYLTGCATSFFSTKFFVSYESDPPGAKLYIGKKYLGLSPQNVYYDLTDKEKESGVLKSKPVTAVWVSGAKKTFKRKMKFDYESRSYLEYVIKRPRNHPNYQMDLTYGQNHERNMLLKRKVELEQEQLEVQQEQLDLQKKQQSNDQN